MDVKEKVHKKENGQYVESNSSAIQTYTNRMVDPFDPDPNEINLYDIVHALSNLSRFGGHINQPYSVLQHSVFCYYLAIENSYTVDLLSVLMHDASEAYLVDIPRPIKNKLPEYKKAEDKLMKVIANKFNFQYPFHGNVKEIDNIALRIEQENLMDDLNDKPRSFSNILFNNQDTIKLKFFEIYFSLI